MLARLFGADGTSGSEETMPHRTSPLLQGADSEGECPRKVDTKHASSHLIWRAAVWSACIGALGAVISMHHSRHYFAGSLLSVIEPSPSTPQLVGSDDPQDMSLMSINGFTQLEVQGRSLWVYHPYFLKRISRKAVIVLHGSESSPAAIARSSQFHDVAARTSPGFFVVYPEMAVPGSDSWGFGAPWEEAYFRSVVDVLESDFMIDRQEVFVVGHSNGGTMALFLQNNFPDMFKAAAAVEAGVGHLQDWRNASYGLPTMIVWNHNDPVLFEYGGDQLFQNTIDTLQRHSGTRVPHQKLPLPSGYSGIASAERWIWNEDASQPRLTVVSWSSDTPTHSWVNHNSVHGAPLDAAILVCDFFIDVGSKAYRGN